MWKFGWFFIEIDLFDAGGGWENSWRRYWEEMKSSVDNWWWCVKKYSVERLW